MPPVLATMSGMLQGMMGKLLPKASEEDMYGILTLLITEVLYWRDGVYYATTVEASEDETVIREAVLITDNASAIRTEGGEEA
jgi:hypothetical protein